MTEVVIQLTKGRVARVSAKDADRVNSHKWYASCNHSGIWYARAKINGRIESMHRYILGLAKADGVVDHIDCDGLNNTRENIRVVTPQQNSSRRINLRGAHMRGAFRHHRGNRWVSYITCNGKRRYLGCFESAAEASAAYHDAASKMFGEYAPPCDQTGSHLCRNPQQPHIDPLAHPAQRKHPATQPHQLRDVGRVAPD